MNFKLKIRGDGQNVRTFCVGNAGIKHFTL